MSTQTDDRTALRDRTSFGAVFDRLYPALVRYASAILHDGDGARDVVHDAFVKMWEERDRIRIKTSLTALLYTMVRNRALNVLRRDRRLDRNVSAIDAAGTASQDASGRDRALARRVSTRIEELPDRRREAFMLSRYHDLTHADIARIMQLSERTVNTHILLALRTLRARLEAFEQEEMTQ